MCLSYWSEFKNKSHVVLQIAVRYLYGLFCRTLYTLFGWTLLFMVFFFFFKYIFFIYEILTRLTESNNFTSQGDQRINGR